MAIVGDLQSGGWAPGARLELGLGPRDARWRARFAAVGVGRHQLDLPPGSASWWRAFVQVGADVDVARGRRWAVVLGAGALGGVVSIAGAGFTVDRATAQHRFSAGRGGSALEARLGRLRPWLGAARRRVGAPPSPGNSRGRDQLGLAARRADGGAGGGFRLVM